MSGPIDKRLKEIQAAARPESIAKEVFDYFVNITPIDNGNARRRTKLNGDTIHANYAYATRLNDGYSNQAKDGMSKPTLKKLSDLVKNNLKR
jgi:hypothetical protein